MMTLTLVKESVKAIRHLVSGGANPNGQNSHGLTPSDLVNSNKYINQETQQRIVEEVDGPWNQDFVRVMNGPTGERIIVP